MQAKQTQHWPTTFKRGRRKEKAAERESQPKRAANGKKPKEVVYGTFAVSEQRKGVGGPPSGRGKQKPGTQA